MSAELDSGTRNLLKDKNFAHVVTQGRDGTPHAVVVWVESDGGEVVLNTARGRRWQRNLEDNPEVLLSIHAEGNGYDYAMVRGRVTEMTSEGADAHIDSLAKKYLGQDTYPYRQPGEERVIVRITPEAVVHRAQ